VRPENSFPHIYVGTVNESVENEDDSDRLRWDGVYK